MTNLECYRISKSISLTFLSKKYVKSIKVTQEQADKYRRLTNAFIQIDVNYMKLLCLYVSYEYNPGSYEKMMEYAKEVLQKSPKNRPKFSYFCDILKNNKQYFNEDLSNINKVYSIITVSEIFDYYRQNKIKFYTLYELVHDLELSTLQKLEIEKIGSLMNFLIFEWKNKKYKKQFIIEGEKQNFNFDLF
jgi:hypothetical protein